jgi:hypothetical protein
MIYSRLVDKTTKKISIIDGVSNIEESTFEKENEIFIF